MEIQRVIRGAVMYVLVILVFGVLVPARKGLGFLDPELLAAYACLGMVIAGPAAAHAFGQRPASLAQAIRWIVKAVLFGELVAAAMLAFGLATVYELNRAAFFPPDLESLAYVAMLGFAASLALASLAAWIAIEFSTASARTAMRLVLLGLLALFYLRGRWLPAVATPGTLLCLLAAALFLLLLRLRLAKV